MRAERFWLAVGAAALCCGLVALAAPLVGSARVDFARAFAGLSPDREILFYARLPRVLLALLAGGVLAVTGVVFQSVLRDPLAEPYTLGVSSGAAVGAVLAICLGWSGWGGYSAVGLAAAAGAAAALLLVLALGFEGRRLSSFTLLLAGVTVNSMCLAAILLLHSLATFSQSFAITRWLMGGLDAIGYVPLAALASLALPAAALLFWRARDWNLLAFGEEWAATRGVSARRLTILGYVAGSLLTGAITSLTGPIGFVGLIVPHAVRLAAGGDHRLLLPCSFFAGAAFLAICDTVARTVLAPAEIPVGVVTALVGGPVFILLLRSRRRSLWL
jgi:iron complex transport system permease protein